MIVRDGDDYVEHSLLSVLPYAKQVIVTVDSRSTDKTWDIVGGLAKKWEKLTVFKFAVHNPLTDLVDMRNCQLNFLKANWVWIVDSDEVWPKESIEKIVLLNDEAYGFCPIVVYNDENELYSLSRRPTMRIFRYSHKTKWVGEWGNEKLMSGDTDLCFQYKVLEPRYIHLTLRKKDRWRDKLNMERRRRFPVVESSLRRMPENIIKLVKEIHEKKESV